MIYRRHLSSQLDLNSWRGRKERGHLVAVVTFPTWLTSYKTYMCVRFSAAVHTVQASTCTFTCQQACIHVYKRVWVSYVIHSLEFGPDILVSSSWICLTSREMCCSRSLFCSSSWWTRAWASSRAVASALSWSFSRWTCTGGGESRKRWTVRGGENRERNGCSVQRIQTFSPGHRS